MASGLQEEILIVILMNHVDNPFESPSLLGICVGMLGLEEGVEQVLAGCRTILHVEIESFVCENLVQQMEQGVLAPAPIWTNLKTFPWEAFRGKFHWLIGGYPCQPFSNAGLRGGTEDPRHLYPFISRGIKKSRPVGVFFENVEGHISLGLRDVCKDIRKLGYQVEVGIFSAAEVGAPHRRNRVFILGLENSFLLRMRGWSDEEREYWKRQIQTPRSSELADTGLLGPKERQVQPVRIEQCGQAEGVVDTEDQGNGGESREFCEEDGGSVGGLLREPIIAGELGNATKSGSQESGQGGIGKFSKEDGGGMDNRFEQPSSSGVADSNYCNGFNVRGQASREQKFYGFNDDGCKRWPARPGEQQYEWEAPRLESSVGYAVDGYNYREDLLRMAGNAVVRQQSEKAFRTLLLKFL